MASTVNSICVIVILILKQGTASTRVTCDFEDGFCGWTTIKSSRYHWLRREGPTEDATSGPFFDHTFRDTSEQYGYYAYTRGNDGFHDSSPARLTSSLLNITSVVGLTFWYLMNGNSIGTLQLLRINATDPGGTTLWKRQRRQGKTWQMATIMLETGSFELQFQTTAIGPAGADIAIDDIVFQSEPPEVRTMPPTTPAPPTTTTTLMPSTTIAKAVINCSVQSRGKDLPGTCNFEYDSCDYNTSSGNRLLKWVRANGTVGYDDSVIQGDHTTGNGSYIYLATDIAIDVAPGTTATLTSQTLDLETRVSIQFAYTMPNYATAHLVVYVKTGNITRPIAAITKKDVKSWQVFNVSACVEAESQLVFEAVFENYYSFVGLDDIQVTSEGDSGTPDDNTVFRCLFEEDMCGFQNDLHIDLRWTRAVNQIHTPSNQNEYYASFNGSVGKSAESARMVSPLIRYIGLLCISFDYFAMPDSRQGLHVYTQKATQLAEFLWESVHSTGPKWLTKNVNFKSEEKFQLIFDATHGLTKNGQIGVDNIFVTKGQCVSMTTVPAMTDFICSFDTDMCSFSQSDVNTAQWQVGVGSSGPVADHTTGLGKYLFIKTSGKKMSVLVSPIFHASQYKCFLMWYHMTGSHLGSLNIYVTPANEELANYPTWTISKQTPRWNQLEVNILIKGDFKIVIKAEPGVGPDGDISIDDIDISTDPCKENTGTSTTMVSMTSQSSAARVTSSTVATPKWISTTASSTSVNPPPTHTDVKNQLITSSGVPDITTTKASGVSDITMTKTNDISGNTTTKASGVSEITTKASGVSDSTTKENGISVSTTKGQTSTHIFIESSTISSGGTATSSKGPKTSGGGLPERSIYIAACMFAGIAVLMFVVVLIWYWRKRKTTSLDLIPIKNATDDTGVQHYKNPVFTTNNVYESCDKP